MSNILSKVNKSINLYNNVGRKNGGSLFGRSPLSRFYPESSFVSSEIISADAILSGQNINTQADDSEVDYEDVSFAYKNYTLLTRGIGIRAMNVAPFIPQVWNTRTKSWRLNHRVSRAFSKANPSSSGMLLNTSYEVDTILMGEWYAQVIETESGLEIWHRRPDFISIEQGLLGGDKQRKGILNYKYQGDDGIEFDIKPEDMLYIRNFNPNNELHGVSSVKSILRYVYSDITTHNWISDLTKNKGIPPYVFMVSKKIAGQGGLRRDQKKEIQRELIKQLQGPRGAVDPLILDSDQQLKTVSYKPTELAYITLMNMNQDMVTTGIGVPNELMGQGEATHENFAQAMVYLWSLTLKSDIDFRDNDSTEFFRQRGDLKRTEVIKTNLEEVSFLQESMTNRLENANQVFSLGGWSANQVSDRFQLGMPNNTEGDIIYAPNNITPIGSTPVEEDTLAAKYFRGVVKKKSIKITKQLPDDSPSFVEDYENDIASLIEQANDGDLTEDEFSEELTEIVIAFALLAFLAGSGLSDDELSNDAIAALSEQTEIALQGVDNLTIDVFDGRLGGDNDSQLNVAARIGLWAGVGLNIYNRGITFETANRDKTWIIDPAKENCNTCLRFSGQTKTAHEWGRIGYWPQSFALDCKGFNCGCRFG